MRTATRVRVLAIAALAGISALPLLGDWLRSHENHCALDGTPISADFSVRVVAADGRARSFCGVTCADKWLARQSAPAKAVLVKDCVTGKELAAREATFVRSLEGWREGAPDRIRAFALRAEAQRHIDAYGGTLLAGEARPLTRRQTP